MRTRLKNLVLARLPLVGLIGLAGALTLVAGSSLAPSSIAARTVVKPKPPIISPHPNMRAEATAPQGAQVAYRPARVTGATSVKYSKASGTWFRLGTTVVTITARNKVGTTRATFKVTVVDTTAPTLSPLTDMTMTATTSAGANATFTVTATDTVDHNVAVSCVPPSGSLFAVGTTTVNCTARDASANVATGAFKVIVNPLLPPGVVAGGHYTGTTSQGKPVSFSATADGFHVTGLSITADMTCSPSATVSITYTSALDTILSDGNFDASGSGSLNQPGYAGSWTVSMHGLFAVAGTVSGTFQEHLSLTAPGAYECDTGALTWTASHTS